MQEQGKIIPWPNDKPEPRRYYIETENVLTEGTKVDIAVTTKQAGCFELFGKVAWSFIDSKQPESKRSGGMGIKFLEQNPAFKNAVNSLAGNLSSALAPT